MRCRAIMERTSEGMVFSVGGGDGGGGGGDAAADGGLNARSAFLVDMLGKRGVTDRQRDGQR